MYLVGSPRKPEGNHGGDGHDSTIVGLNQLPISFVNFPVMSQTKKGKIVEIAGPAVDPVDMSVILGMLGGLAPQ